MTYRELTHRRRRPDDDAPVAATDGWTTIRPASGLLPGFDLREIWAYREVALTLAGRHLRVRYKQTVLGVGWVLLRPLLGLGVFTFLFGHLAKLPSQGVPYPVFLLAGLVIWNFIAVAVTDATGRLVTDRELVTKIYFPRILAPLSCVLPPLVDLAITSIVLVVFMAAYGVTPDLAVLTLPLWLLSAVVVSLGIGMLFGALNVQYRDVGNAIGLIIQFWQFVSPVVYPSTALDGTDRVFLALNPVTGIVDGFRWAVLAAPAPEPIDLLSAASAVVLTLVGLVYFQHFERRFADLI